MTLTALLRRITGFSLGWLGLSWDRDQTAAIRTTDELISVTSRDNSGFIAFLEDNVNRIVFLDSHVDASVVRREHFELVEAWGLELDILGAGRLSELQMPLLSDDGEQTSLVFHLLNARLCPASTGGTGTLMVPFRGFFDVSVTHHSGPSRTFHLREIEGSLDQLERFTRSRKKPSGATRK